MSGVVPASITNVVAIAAVDCYNLAIIADAFPSNIQLTNTRPVIQFHTFSGRQYAVEYCTNFSSGGWMPLLSTNLQGTGREITVTDTNNPSMAVSIASRNGDTPRHYVSS